MEYLNPSSHVLAKEWSVLSERARLPRMSPRTQSGAADDAPSEGERREEELPSCTASVCPRSAHTALGSTSRAHPTAARTAANYSNYPPLTPSFHGSANLIAGIITRFNKQISDGKEHEIFFFFFFFSSGTT